jgi:long-chain fatty acid transport protein
MSSNPAALSDNGHDSSDGFGLKLGWQGQVTDTLTLAASWSSKIKTDRFSDYRGLFAEQGGFDVPETYGLGFAWQMNPQWTLAGDWQRINYSDVASVGNPLIPITQLGQDNGSGFGWQDINVYKLGVSYDWSSRLTFRAGYSYADQPVPSSETFFNILAPGVVQEHVSLGASWRPSPAQELTFAYTRALEESVEGNGSLAAFGGGEADLSMSQDILGLAWSYRF